MCRLRIDKEREARMSDDAQSGIVEAAPSKSDIAFVAYDQNIFRL